MKTTAIRYVFETYAFALLAAMLVTLMVLSVIEES